MEKNFFVNEILKDTLLPFVEQVYPDGHRFQQDNDPKHKSKLAQEFMGNNGINWWKCWPSESPDLNPIEMVWNQMKRYIAKKEPQTKQELVSSILHFWTTEMTVRQCNRYIDHVFKVAPICVLMKGAATADRPDKILNVPSAGHDFKYFMELLASETIKRKLATFNI